MFEIGAGILSFQQEQAGNPDFGALRVRFDGGELHIDIRVLAPDSRLPSELSARLGRRVEAFVGGDSYAVLNERWDRATQVLEGSVALLTGGLRLERPFEQGQITLRVNRADVSMVNQLALDPEVRVEIDDSILPEIPANAGGNPINACSFGFSVEADATGTVGMMTAAHCPDSQSMQGVNMGPVQFEYCSYRDRQLHEFPTAYNTFLDWYGVTTNIYEVAGGFYEGQPYLRRGRNTNAIGTISNITTFAVNGSTTDCPTTFNVSGFALYNTTGGAVVAGDSGGPMFLSYAGYWFLGGLTSAQTIPGTHSGIVAWRNIPAGWTACTTNQNPC